MGYLKEGADYFFHDVKAREDMKIKKLRAHYGINGYGFYFFLLEYIYSNKDYSLDMRDEDNRVLLADEMRFDLNTFDGILQKCLDVGLFSKDIYEKEKRLTSDAVLRRVRVLEEKRAQKREAKRTEREQKSTDVASDNGVNDGDVTSDNNKNNDIVASDNSATDEMLENMFPATLNSRVEESRVEESRDKNMDVRKKIKNTLPARACAREGYEDIMNNLEVSDIVRPMLWEFIKHCQLNKRTLTNAKLEDILIRLDTLLLAEKDKIASLKKAIDGGYFDIAEQWNLE